MDKKGKRLKREETKVRMRKEERGKRDKRRGQLQEREEMVRKKGDLAMKYGKEWGTL